MDNEIIYSFVEILEQPQRVRNIKSKSKIFDYLLEASQTQERFEQFMESLDEYASWASLGIAIMASDMLPTAKIFESELSENFTLPRTPGSFDERNALNKLLSYCGRGLFSQKKHRDQFMRYLVNSLSQEEFNFIVTCLKQTYKNEVYNNFKLMFEHDKMKKNLMDFFSFAIDRSSEKSTEFTNKCFALKSPIRKIVKVGLTMFEMEIFFQKEMRMHSQSRFHIRTGLNFRTCVNCILMPITRFSWLYLTMAQFSSKSQSR